MAARGAFLDENKYRHWIFLFFRAAAFSARNAHTRRPLKETVWGILKLYIWNWGNFSVHYAANGSLIIKICKNTLDECTHKHSTSTVQCRYNAVNFLPIPFKRHLIACPSGWGMGCLLWVQMLVNFLLLSVQQNLWYTMLDRIMTALYCKLSGTYNKGLLQREM